MTGSAARGGAPGEFEGRARLAATPGQVPARPNAFSDGGPQRSRAATRPQTGGGLRLSGKHLLAAERSRGLTLYQSLAASRNRRDVELRRYLWINASRFDLIDENKPFVGTDAMPPGRGFYPANLTRDQVEQYVKQHPEQKAAIYDQFTIVRWHQGKLETVPYHIAFRAFLEPAARLCGRRPSSAMMPPSRIFFGCGPMRCSATITSPSDLAWLDLKNPKFDIIFAPYETYMDGPAGRERFLRRGGDGAQRAREQEAGSVPEICAADSGRAAAGGGRPSFETWVWKRRWK